MDKLTIEKIILDKLNEYRFELPKDEYELIAEELAETIVKNSSTPVAVGQSEQCDHDFEPYYNWCSELAGYRCEKCGEEKE